MDLKTKYQLVFERKTTTTASPMIGPRMPIHWNE